MEYGECYNRKLQTMDSCDTVSIPIPGNALPENTLSFLVRETIHTLQAQGLLLNAEQVAEFMGISRAKAYTLMHSEGFPTIHIGKRMMVSREKLLEWLEEHTAKTAS